MSKLFVVKLHNLLRNSVKAQNPKLKKCASPCDKGWHVCHNLSILKKKIKSKIEEACTSLHMSKLCALPLLQEMCYFSFCFCSFCCFFAYCQVSLLYVEPLRLLLSAHSAEEKKTRGTLENWCWWRQKSQVSRVSFTQHVSGKWRHIVHI